MKLAVLITGSEVLGGRVVDTNSSFIAAELQQHHLALRHVLSCDDGLDEIVSALTYLCSRVDCVIVSGGLGPTTDDLTREALSVLAGQPLEQDHQTEAHLRELFKRRGRPFSENNLKQAAFPRGASIIPNPAGTAAGFELELRRGGGKTTIFCVPGVPHELRAMFNDAVLPRILAAAGRPHIYKAVYKVFGLGEAVVGSKIEALGLPPSIRVSYRASFPEIEVTLTSAADELEACEARIVRSIGPAYIFSRIAEEPFERAVQTLLLEKSCTISAAESCTGGLISSILTRSPGSSRVYNGGVVAYANEAKIGILSVPAETISRHGAVSAECALAMAEGAVRLFRTGMAVSTTGVAGPDGGSVEKPVGLFYVGISGPAFEARAFECFYNVDRIFNQRFAAYKALDIVRRTVAGVAVDEN